MPEPDWQSQSRSPQHRRNAVQCNHEQVFQAVATILKRYEKRLVALEQRRAAANGRGGVGIADVTIVNGHLHIYLTDGTTKDCGQVVGRDAPPAPPPRALEIERDEDGRVIRGVLR